MLKKNILIIYFMITACGILFAQDSLNCKLISKIDNVNAYSIASKDSLLFVGGMNGLDVFNITDINNPILKFHGSYEGGFINEVSVSEDYLYLGNSGLIILDISNPYSPVQTAFIEMNTNVEEIKVVNSIAYLGVTMGYQLMIYDVSDPYNPVMLSQVKGECDDIWGLQIRDTLLFAASEDTGVTIFNIKDPSAPSKIVNFIPDGTSFPGANWTITDVRISGNFVFASHPRDLNVFDISDLENPKQIDFIEGAGGASIEVDGDYLYGLSNQKKLNIVDISNPEAPKLVGFYSLSGAGGDLCVNNKIVILPEQSDGISFIQFDTPTDISYNDIIHNDYRLAQNYPNPFNPTTTINYQLASEGKVTLKVFDLLGREVTTLINQYQNAGNYEVEFSADKFTSEISSGIYLYQLQAEGFIDTKKMVLLK